MGHRKLASPRWNLLILFSAGTLLFGQVNPREQLHNAFVLEQEGRFDEATEPAKWVIHSDTADQVERGRAFIVLGFAYRMEGNFADARLAFERSLAVFEKEPANLGDYASALQNYGGLYAETGQLEITVRMWRKALSLRLQMGDHAASARSLTDLAGLALTQKRLRDARSLLNRAYEERRFTPDLIPDDSLVLRETEAWLSTGENHYTVAIEKYKQALEMCEQIHGAKSWLSGWDRMLLGIAYLRSGDARQAMVYMQSGSAILEHALGQSNPKYLAAEIAYSRALDRTGAHSEAKQLRRAAQKACQDLLARQCVRCTIDATAFR